MTNEWYFFALISLLILLAYIKLIYTKFLTEYISAAFNIQFAHKLFNETGIVRKRVGFTLDFIYLVSAASYIFALSDFFNYTLNNYSELNIFFISFIVLLLLIIFRLLIMKSFSIIFHQKKIISEFLFHFYLYNKLLGLLLIPFLLFIPYTEGNLQKVFVYLSFIVISGVIFYKLFRIINFLLKNVVFIFYLILYLCVLELIPFMVIIKFLLSLEKGS